MHKYELPKLEFIDCKADASKWLGEGVYYYLRPQKNGYDGHTSDITNTWKLSGTAEGAKASLQETFEKRLAEPMNCTEALEYMARGGIAKADNGLHYTFREAPDCSWYLRQSVDTYDWRDGALYKRMLTMNFYRSFPRVYGTEQPSDS